MNPTNPALVATETNGAMSAAKGFAITLHVLNASTEADFEGIFAKLTELGASGLVIGADPLFASRSARLGDIAARHVMPTVFENRSFAAAGGLASYGGNLIDRPPASGHVRRSHPQGEKPADLPVQQGTKLELFINGKSAKALGITIPLPLLGRADEVKTGSGQPAAKMTRWVPGRTSGKVRFRAAVSSVANIHRFDLSATMFAQYVLAGVRGGQ